MPHMLLWGLEHLKGVLELSPLDAERRCTWKGGPVQTQNLFYLYPANREQLSLSLLLCLPCSMPGLSWSSFTF